MALDNRVLLVDAANGGSDDNSDVKQNARANTALHPTAYRTAARVG